MVDARDMDIQKQSFEEGEARWSQKNAFWENGVKIEGEEGT